MSLLADALQPFVVRDLTNVAGRMRLMTLPDSLIEPMAAYDLTFDNPNRAIVVDFRDTDPVSIALAADTCRLSCAALQTVSLAVAEMIDRDSMAWSLIKLYYSAFYAGNALIRLFGESCSYFDRQHALRVNQLAAALNRAPAFNIDGGLYHCVIDSSGTLFTCTRTRSGVGGAHEAFWQIFGLKMQGLAAAVLSGPLLQADAQAVFVRLEEFRALLARRGAHSWLSAMRNEIQYRHEHRAWFPDQLRARERETLSRRANRWTSDPMDITIDTAHGSLGEFIACCSFVVSLCNLMLKRIAERSSVGVRSFICMGPIAFLNDRAAA